MRGLCLALWLADVPRSAEQVVRSNNGQVFWRLAESFGEQLYLLELTVLNGLAVSRVDTVIVAKCHGFALKIFGAGWLINPFDIPPGWFCSQNALDLGIVVKTHSS